MAIKYQEGSSNPVEALENHSLDLQTVVISLEGIIQTTRVIHLCSDTVRIFRSDVRVIQRILHRDSATPSDFRITEVNQTIGYFLAVVDLGFGVEE